MTELNSFGSVLSFAIQLEGSFQQYYQTAGLTTEASDAEKRRSKLERARREYVVEITLEPIEGLSEAGYALDFSDTSEDEQKKLAQTAAQFYADAAPKINVRQVQRILERCGQEHAAVAQRT
jgi:hypothetical protein